MSLGVQEDTPYWVVVAIVLGTTTLSIAGHLFYALAFSTRRMVSAYRRSGLIFRLGWCQAADQPVAPPLSISKAAPAKLVHRVALDRFGAFRAVQPTDRNSIVLAKAGASGLDLRARQGRRRARASATTHVPSLRSSENLCGQALVLFIAK
jgi:hypothetical protein